ncbi:MAG: UvrD-helicase domain-containing protein [Anaerolineae bacterium]|nr:UvrD-helicase domain-containing protein [Anaerolineae bacterium]MDW7991999.1 UvrD-helicase domain-containing protein [Anaerolineae bacterium]
MTDLLKDLNPQQQKAVTVSDGPVLVLAGPGSGKTRVLTYRVAYLVLERGIPPWRVMAVTFTNKAAQEMGERLQRLLGHARAADLTLGTFHATCARILRREGEAIGIPSNYVIYDTDDQMAVVRQALKDLDIDEKRFAPTSIHSIISRAKNELIPPEAFQPASYLEEVARRVYERYQHLLRANAALDFDDLLMETVRLFRERPDILARYQERYLHILVDEFQDTNMAQYVLLRQLAGRHRNLFVVADEDQSIYRWRGADYRNIFRLREDYPDLATVLLEQNYRSTQTILDAANAVIARNPHRTPKRLFTHRGRGPKIVVHEAYDPEEEAQFVVDTIAELVLKGEAQPGDCAVMYRINAQSRALEEAFIRAGLPYRLVGATRFYARREIKDLVAYLRVVHNPHDSASLFRILNVPPRGIGPQTVRLLEDAARIREVSLWQMIEDVAHGSPAPSLPARIRTALVAFHRAVCAWREASASLTVASLMDRIILDTAYEAYLRDGTEEGEDRWENVQELRSVAAQYPEATLADFLALVALVSDVDNLTESVNAPVLLTLHSAKGLEFPVVFIVGLEEGMLPHTRSLDDPEALAEERRLFYVGITRAKDRLFLTYSFRRARWGEYGPNAPSRFLEDIPESLTEGARVRRRRARKPTAWGVLAELDARIERSAPVSADKKKASRTPPFQVGDAVTHTAFGSGVVLEVAPMGDEWEVTVAFERAGIRHILGSYLQKK